ncbi:snare protein [Anaeramoeba flamelloides]|uniref:Snare protein n=1 Tax=Anaeramoeba flamelloides TaxID=1746091 RepID=A0AAV7ZPC4_9EUKA|nr:snare protein [Anaeramoeba flamelloides]KAJ6226784.1 snare protein [Anaeramoeba flamelloides]
MEDGIIYALISRDSSVLVEHTNSKGNFVNAALQILEKIDAHESNKVSYIYDSFYFHYVSEDGFVYMCMTSDSFKRRIAFAFLEDIKNRFSQKFGSTAKNANRYGLQDGFGSDLRTQMDYYSTSPNADKISKVKVEVEEVKKIMVQNIEKVIDRGQKIDLLVDKAEQLNEDAFTFRRNAVKLKRHMWYKNAKLMVILIIVIIAILYFIIAGICGGLSLKPRCIKN